MEFVVYEEVEGKWKWDLCCTDGLKIATSGTTYKSWENCVSAVRTIRDSRAASIKTIVNIPPETSVQSTTQSLLTPIEAVLKPLW